MAKGTPSAAAAEPFVCYVEQRPARHSTSSRRAVVAAGLLAVAVCAAVRRARALPPRCPALPRAPCRASRSPAARPRCSSCRPRAKRS